MNVDLDIPAQALRAACRKEYGTDWNNDVAWDFTRAAMLADPVRAAMVKLLSNCASIFADQPIAKPISMILARAAAQTAPAPDKGDVI